MRLATVIGETLIRFGGVLTALIGCVVGSIVYRVAIEVALSADFLGLQASGLNLVTAILAALALILPCLRKSGLSA